MAAAAESAFTGPTRAESSAPNAGAGGRVSRAGLESRHCSRSRSAVSGLASARLAKLPSRRYLLDEGRETTATFRRVFASLLSARCSLVLIEIGDCYSVGGGNDEDSSRNSRNLSPATFSECCSLRTRLVRRRRGSEAFQGSGRNRVDQGRLRMRSSGCRWRHMIKFKVAGGVYVKCLAHVDI